MKRFLSALTAFCMCTSMAVSALPASAVKTMTSVNAVNAQADAWTWSLSDTVFDPATDKYATVSVTVDNDPGTYGFSFGIEISSDNGKTYQSVSDAKFVIKKVDEKNNAYNALGSMLNNLDDGYFGKAGDPGKVTADVVAPDGGKICDLIFQVPDDAKPGQKYLIRFSECEVSNYAQVKSTPAMREGSITIKGDGTEITDPPQTDPPATTKPTEKDTQQATGGAPNTGEQGQFDKWTWYVEDAVYDPAKDKAATINIKIGGEDPGILGYTLAIQVDGKNPADAGFTVKKFVAKDAYENLKGIQFSLDEGTCGAASKDSSVDQFKAGDTLLQVTMLVPESAKPGDKFKISLTDLKVANFAQETLNPAVQAGTLTIAGGDTEQTDPPETKPNDVVDGFTYKLTDYDYKLGVDKAATVELRVYGDPGTFGVTAGILIDGKPVAGKPNGVSLRKIVKGNAYPNFGQFLTNIDEGEFGATVTDAAYTYDMIAEDGALVATYTFSLPEDAKVGDKYVISFGDVTVANFAKDSFTPTTVAGTITVVDPDSTTTDPVDTEPPTEPKTEPAPTETVNTPPSQQTSNVKAEWDIADVEAEAGATVPVAVKISGNEGFNSYIAKIKADKNLTIGKPKSGESFSSLDLVYNPDKSTYAGTDYSTGKDVAADGDVFIMYYTVPAEATPGTKYDLTFDGLDVYNIDMVKLIPTTSAGSITVVGEKPTDFNHESKEVAAKWSIAREEVEAGATVDLAVSVSGDADGLNSFIAKLNADSRLTVVDKVEQGLAYPISFAYNINDLAFAGTNNDGKTQTNVKAADGVVFTVRFTVPADAEPGTQYDVKFADLDIEGIDMVQYIPNKEDGWIKVKDDEPTEMLPEAGDAGEWIIGTKTVPVGTTTAEIPVYVEGDQTDLNSYIMKMGTSGLTIKDVKAVLNPDGFVYNADDKTFGMTAFDAKENIKVDGNLFLVTFNIPENAEPGTKYDLTFDGLEVLDIYMNTLDPKKTPGWIQIEDEEPTTEEPTQPTETDEPTQPTETDEPTQPTETDEPTQPTETDEPTQPTETDEPTQPTETDEPTQPTETEEPTQPIETDEPTQPTETDEPTQPTETDEPTQPSETLPPAGEAGRWVISTETVVKGTTTATIPVYVEQDKTGLNSFIMKMGTSGLKITGVEAVLNKDGFVYNADGKTFGMTAFDAKENIIADGNLFLVTFEIPADAEADTVYDLTFDGLEIYDINMNQLDPDKVPGWIKIVAPETQPSETDEPTQPSETDEPNQPSETDEPTQPTETDEPTQPTETDEPTQPTETDEPTQPTETDEPTQPTETDEPTQPTETDEPTQPTETDEPTQPTETDEPTQPTETDEPTQPTETDEPTQPTETDEPTQPSETDEPTQPTETDEPTQPTETDEPTQPSETDEPTQPTETDEPTQPSETPEPSTEEETTIEYEASVKGRNKFYFAHDMRPFDQADLLVGDISINAVVKNSKGEVIDRQDNVAYTLVSSELATVEGGYKNPQAAYDALKKAYVVLDLTLNVVVKVGDQEMKLTIAGVDGAHAYIAVKGDTNLDGVCDASDAARVLMYAASYGAGNDPQICKVEDLQKVDPNATWNQAYENFVYFLSDTTSESEDHGATSNVAGESASAVDASDAAQQLKYAAVYGANNTCNWATDVFPASKALPKYTGAIREWELAH